MKEQYAGIGGSTDYIQEVTGKVLKDTINEVDTRTRKRMTREHSFQYITQPSKKVSFRVNQVNFKRRSPVRLMAANQRTLDPYQDQNITEIPKQEDSNYESSDSSSFMTEEGSMNQSVMKQQIDFYKNAYNYQSDREIKKLMEKREIQRSVKKEISSVEQMFPLSLASQSSKQVLDKRQTLMNISNINPRIKIQEENKFKSFLVKQQSQKNKNGNSVIYESEGSRNYFNQPQQKMQSIAQSPQKSMNDQSSYKSSLFQSLDKAKQLYNTEKKQEESFISDLSEQPYKQMPEKQIMFKILDKHQAVVTDKKKWQQHLQRAAFLKGLFNNQSLQWELRNNALGSQNQASLNILKHTVQERLSQGDNRSSKDKINQRENRKKIMQASKSLASFQDLVNKTIEQPRTSIKREKSVELFESIKKSQAELVMECKTARKSIKEEKKRFFQDEDQLKRLINIQKKYESRIESQRQKVMEAETFARMVSKDNNSLRKKMFESALQEFRDEEYQEIKNKEIENFLNADFKRRKDEAEKYFSTHSIK